MISESEMIPILESHFREKSYKVYTEFPMLSRHIDLVCVRAKQVIAVEAKISAWKRALRQAGAYRLCAHRVYVALWHKYAHRVNPELLTRKGIGLLSVDRSRVEELLPAQFSKIIHTDLMNRVRETVKKENKSPKTIP